jgi:anthranilate synthase component 2
MILLIDHYDSFIDMIADYIARLGYDYHVLKTDDQLLSTLDIRQYSHIIIGPGPGHPQDASLAGVYSLLQQAITSQVPLLGICLGHQIIAANFAYPIKTAAQICHGKVDTIKITYPSSLFANTAPIFKVTRYHSLIVADDVESTQLCISAVSVSGEIMALEHTTLPLYGVQFHPESIMSEYGMQILANFLAIKNRQLLG